MSDELHKLGEVLRAAREAKGVDLARVERDTKIRARYLAALEHGDYRELPGAVYTRGFLRNYGHYLGLDAEYLIDLFRLESSALQTERPQAVAPPRPIATRGRGAFVVTPNALAATILSIVVIALIAYFGYEFWTFARTPDLRIVEPAGDVAQYGSLQYTVRGMTAANSRITVKNGQRENPEVVADASGAFTINLKLVPGSNLITLVAHDPLTKRDSDAVTRTIRVTLSTASPTPAPGVALTAPAEGATVSGPLTIAGTSAPGAKLTVTATPTGAPPITFSVIASGSRAVKVTADLPAAPKPTAVAAGADGAFTANMPLAPGTWQLAIAAADGMKVQRSVTVAVADGLAGNLAVVGAPSYLEVEEDGTRKAGTYGAIVAGGKTIALQATSRIRIRAGNAGAVQVTINGIGLDRMGANGAVVEWIVTRLK